tara:strand:+ start:570 stop:1034 length:465 start_codon:yes stop_codon:yes gene_type:complete
MKIEVKYNIDFKRILKELDENKLFKTLNDGISHKVAETSSRYILEGKVKPKLSKNNPRGIKAPPLFDTGKLANSLKGSSRGITANKPTDGGIPYRSHRESDFTWNNKKVPKREFIVAKSKGKLLLRGTSALVDKIYKAFQDKFIKLLNKRLRKR